MEDVAWADADSWYTMAVKTDGTLWAWGSNSYGQFGDGTNEGSHVPRQIMEGVSRGRASRGRTVTVTVKPDSGYTLEGLTVTDKNGSRIKLTDQGSGKYTFTMPASSVNIGATFVRSEDSDGFADVPSDAYYADAVAWAVEQGITTGVTANAFRPDASCTRAQMVTFLWRAAADSEYDAGFLRGIQNGK